MQPVRVCDILQDPAAFSGKVVAVVGRYSFRRQGRFLSEDDCPSGIKHTDGAGALAVGFDKTLAPKTPEHLEIEAGAVGRLLKLIQQRTALAKFRFGTPDYDRWAVVYGRIETGKPGSGPAAANGRIDPEPADEPQLLCAGDSVVLFIVDRH